MPLGRVTANTPAVFVYARFVKLATGIFEGKVALSV
jgi:hypothetical protein